MHRGSKLAKLKARQRYFTVSTPVLRSWWGGIVTEGGNLWVLWVMVGCDPEDPYKIGNLFYESYGGEIFLFPLREIKDMTDDFLDDFKLSDGDPFFAPGGDIRLKKHEQCPFQSELYNCQKEYCMMWENGCLLRQGLIKYVKREVPAVEPIPSEATTIQNNDATTIQNKDTPILQIDKDYESLMGAVNELNTIMGDEDPFNSKDTYIIARPPSKRCPTCQAENPVESTYCNTCGTGLQDLENRLKKS